MDTPFWPDVTPPRNGDLLDETVLNVPIEQLVQRTEYLRQRVQDFQSPFSAVTVSGLTVSTTEGWEPSVGDFVYLDLTTNTIKKALAGATAYDDPDTMSESSDSSYCLGYYLSAENGNVVVIYGQINNLNLASLVEEGEDATSGRYYLSSTSRGKITKYPSGPFVFLGTFVAPSSGAAHAYLAPIHKSMAEAHVHRSVRLSPTILTTDQADDDSVEGWVYDSENNEYWYHMAAGTTLANFWPPIPAQCASLVLDGIELQSKNVDPDNGVFFVGSDTIHLNGSAFSPSNLSAIITFHFIRYAGSDSGVVTSLQAKEGSPIVIRKCGTKTPGKGQQTGDLEIDANFDFGTKDANEPGYNVVKGYKDGNFLLGPVVGSIKKGPGISVTSSGAGGTGDVIISADSSVSGDFDTIALQNAKEEMIGLFPYVKLPPYNSAVPSAFTAKFQVPVDIADIENGYNILFYATMFGYDGVISGADTATFTLGFTYNILPNMYGNYSRSNFKTGLISGDPRTIPIDFAAGYTGFDPVLLTNDTSIPASPTSANGVIRCDDMFQSPPCGNQNITTLETVRPGYLVSVRLSSEMYAGSDNNYYRGAVGVVALRWKLAPVVS